MNLSEYQDWLSKHSKSEEQEALKVVQEILRYHQINREYKVIQFFPRVRFKGMEFDLIILLSNGNTSLNSISYLDRIIGVEFKELDINKVVRQAIERRKFVHYQYIATRNVSLDYPEIFMLTLFGIGWIIWEKNFAKLIIPARMRNTYQKVESLINYLIEKRISEITEEILNRKLTEFMR